MIHVCTVHHRDARWAPIQVAALDRHISEPYQVLAVADGVAVPDSWDQVHVNSTRHGPRLDALASQVLAVADPDDIIMFLDGDAWPIADPLPTVRAAIETGWLAAVCRLEGSGAGWPHPSFCATTVGKWAALGATWQPTEWPDRAVAHRIDVGVDVLVKLAGRPWSPLLRANIRNPHHLFFGVYGDPPVVYHHGAGFRVPFTSRDGRETRTSGRSERLAAIEAMSDHYHRAAVTDPCFWEALCE